MRTNQILFSFLTRKQHDDSRPLSRWLSLMLSLVVSATVLAQTGDVITFTGGQADPKDPNIYVIDAGSAGADETSFSVTLSRPQGATAQRTASITLKNLISFDETIVTFTPGETSKTISLTVYSQGSWSGLLPGVFSVSDCLHADAAYQVLLLNINRTRAAEPAQSELATQLEVIQNTYGFSSRWQTLDYWGEYVLLTVELPTDVRVTEGSRYVLEARYADHSTLAPDADDYGQARTRQLELTPLNAGSVCSKAYYLYHPQDDEFMHTYFDDNYNNRTSTATMATVYPTRELGPFEVANPADGALKYLFYSQTDLPENAAGFQVLVERQKFLPHFSNVSIDKTTAKSGETLTLTATMDNWQLVKRAQQENFMNSFGVTLDEGESLAPRQASFDEATGQLTLRVTMPTVTTERVINVDFGPLKEGGYFPKLAIAGSGSFAVTVQPEAATAVAAQQIVFEGLPADGATISLEKDRWGSAINREYPLHISTLPANATDASAVSYSVTNSGGADAEIEGWAERGFFLDPGTVSGTITLTATLPSGVSASRTFHVQSAPPFGKTVVNKYNIGTAFPLLQFGLEITDDWTVEGDKVTVNFTHANGTTWTERYTFSDLKRHQTDWQNSYLYDLPFGFTEEHPDVDSDATVGQPLVTAQVLLPVKDGSGHQATVEATATLVPELKRLSFSDHTEIFRLHSDVHRAELTSEVMYLPRKGFTVGYEIPELGLRETYSNLSGEAVPSWLQLEEDGLYYTAQITVWPDIGHQYTRLHLYTLAQRSYDVSETMERFETCEADFVYHGVETGVIYYVNGQEVSGDLTFDDGKSLQEFVTELKATGFTQTKCLEPGYLSVDRLRDIVYETRACFTIYDAIFGEGADLTLSCEGEVIQQVSLYNGVIAFMPPTDGRTYTLTIYFPAYDKTYTNTFVSHPLDNIHQFAVTCDKFNGDISYIENGVEHTIELDLASSPTGSNLMYFYAEEPVSFTFHSGDKFARVNIPNIFQPLQKNFVPELRELQRVYSEAEAIANSYNDHLLWSTYPAGFCKWDSPNPYFCFTYFNDLCLGSTLVKVVDRQGQPITDATVNFACVDKDMVPQGDSGTVTYNAQAGGYLINADPDLYAELIEVVAPGYQPMLNTMYLWDYEYYARNWGRERHFNIKTRHYTIVLNPTEERVNSVSLETLMRQGTVRHGSIKASFVTADLMATDATDQIDYSQTADYGTVPKNVREGRTGTDGWSGTKYAHIYGCMPLTETTPEETTLQLVGTSLNLQPASTTTISRSVFTQFSHDYCLFDFDLADQIATGTTLQPALMANGETLLTLPSLHNSSIDLIALSEENNVKIEPNAQSLTEIDNSAEAQGVDMKDTGKAFDKFNFQVPDVLPFTVNIERDGDYFLVRAVCEVNFLPGGPLTDAMGKLDDLKYFDEQFQACMDAVNTAKPHDDDFFNDIPRWPSAFVGVKGFLSGIGHINRQTGKLDINFYDGGISFEASATARADVSFFIGGFGLSLDAKIALTMAVINRAAANGNVATLPKIDFQIDTQCRVKMCAWAYGGIDIWIAKAAVGVQGGGLIDVGTRTIIPTYDHQPSMGFKTDLRLAMEVFAEGKFLCFKKKKSWTIFDVSKTYLSPDDNTNPFHPDYGEAIFSYSPQLNITKTYRKLRRKALTDLGTPIISDVSGMARPAYLMGGNSLLFNNLKTPGNYNDDRLQVFSNGSKTDLIAQTDVDAPMYDFSTARGGGLEMVAYEQVSQSIDKAELEALSDEDQVRDISQKTEVYVASRQAGGAWTTQQVGTYWGRACINPAVAVQADGQAAAVVWQQGKVKFSEQGDRYIDGSLMLARYNATDGWSYPIEIKRIHRRSVPADYQLTMSQDSILVMLTLKQDIDNSQTGASIVYISVSPTDRVRERYTLLEGSRPQMVNVGGSNLVAFLQQTDNGRDIALNSVNMKGESTGKIAGTMGMDRRMVNSFRVIADDEATDLSDVALLWSQTDQESTTNADEQKEFAFKNRIYAAKICSNDNSLYFSTPIEVATLPADVLLQSMDGFLDGLDMKVAYCVANDNDGAAIMESPVAFTNDIGHTVSFNPYVVSNEQQVPVTITVVNNGFEPIDRIDVTMDGNTTSHDVKLMPMETTDLQVLYRVSDGFDGTISYDVTANFTPANSNALKARRKPLAARPRRIQQSGTQFNVRQIDMALKVLSKKTDATTGVTTIVAEVNNASLLPLAPDMTVKAGLYATPLATEAVGSVVTLSAADLYDASAEQKNKVKIVTLTAQQPDFDQVLYLRTTPMLDDETLKDVHPANNVLAVRLPGKFLLGDVNVNKRIDIGDAVCIVNHMVSKSNSVFEAKAADLNGNGQIDIGDAVCIVNQLVGKATAPAQQQLPIEMTDGQEPQ